MAGHAAEGQESDAVGPRKDLAPSGRPDPDDVIGVDGMPLAVDLDVRRAPQGDVDLLLPELVGRWIPGSLRVVVVRRIGRRGAACR